MVCFWIVDGGCDNAGIGQHLPGGGLILFLLSFVVVAVGVVAVAAVLNCEPALHLLLRHNTDLCNASDPDLVPLIVNVSMPLLTADTAPALLQLGSELTIRECLDWLCLLDGSEKSKQLNQLNLWLWWWWINMKET